MITRILIFISCFVAFKSYSQQTISSEISAINNFFAGKEMFVIECKQSYFEGKEKNPAQVQTLTVAMQDGTIYNKTEDLECIKNDSLSLVVNYETKSIILTPVYTIKNNKTQSVLTVGIDSLLKMCDKRQIGYVGTNMSQIVLSGCNSLYRKIVLNYYIKDHKLKSIQLYPQITQLDDENSYVEIEYVSIKRFEKDNGQYFSFDRFITKTKSGYKLNPLYKAFKLDNYLTHR